MEGKTILFACIILGIIIAESDSTTTHSKKKSASKPPKRTFTKWQKRYGESKADYYEDYTEQEETGRKLDRYVEIGIRDAIESIRTVLARISTPDAKFTVQDTKTIKRAIDQLKKTEFYVRFLRQFTANVRQDYPEEH